MDAIETVPSGDEDAPQQESTEGAQAGKTSMHSNNNFCTQIFFLSAYLEAVAAMGSWVGF